MSKQAEVSFLFLGDGPFSEKSWRPLEDHSQWWGRRDALSRIAIMSMWQSHGYAAIKHPYSRDCCFMLVENDNKSTDCSFDIAAYFLEADQLTETISCPREKIIVSILKEATKASNKVSVSSRTDVRERGAILSNGCTCSQRPWTLSPLISAKQLQSGENSTKVLTETAENHNKKPKIISRDAILNSNSSSIDYGIGKREMVVKMQANCTMEFIRKHALNGSLDLIMKKKNKSSIEIAFHEWQSSKLGFHVDTKKKSDFETTEPTPTSASSLYK